MKHAALSVRRTQRQTALARVGGIAVLALVSACASPDPAVAPRSDGPYIAARPEAFAGSVVGEGYCVDFVKAAAGVPRTAAWQEGTQVRRNPDIAAGTAVATFESDGSYTSESGNHAAIYLSQNDQGIWVYDQWQGQPVHRRLIRFEGGSGKWGSKSNDGTRFAVIE
ncbi:MAG TPA: BPSL0067 family protein [Geminicoccaceae bacterium]|nr:BPSL0067 family protein [Geminicoccaceae bacterium]